MRLFVVEVRRAMHRRLTWVLVGIALAGIAVFGVAAFVSSAGLDVAAIESRHETHPAVLRHWWVAGTGDGILTVAAAFLLMGGLVGGASVVGAEWRAGTVTTMLTWEPRRLRLHLSRVGACAACAAIVSFALQAVFLSGFLPAVLAHGTTAGTDGGWFVGLAAAMARISLLTAVATTVGASIAFAGTQHHGRSGDSVRLDGHRGEHRAHQPARRAAVPARREHVVDPHVGASRGGGLRPRTDARRSHPARLRDRAPRLDRSAVPPLGRRRHVKCVRLPPCAGCG